LREVDEAIGAIDEHDAERDECREGSEHSAEEEDRGRCREDLSHERVEDDGCRQHVLGATNERVLESSSPAQLQRLSRCPNWWNCSTPSNVRG
jgi:hypothetical protein